MDVNSNISTKKAPINDKLRQTNTKVNHAQTSITGLDTKSIKKTSVATPKDELFTNEVLDNAIEFINMQLLSMNRRLEYSVHEGTNIIKVKVFNSYTDELIKELPPESRLDSLHRLRESLGINIDNFI